MSNPASAQSYRLSHVAPVLVVTDLKRAVAYYTDRLAFETSFEWADSPDEDVRYAILTHGDVSLHLTETTEPRPAIAYVFVDGIDAYHAVVAPRDPTITDPLHDLPWGMREFEVTDPDGNRVIFGEHVSRLDADTAGGEAPPR